MAQLLLGPVLRAVSGDRATVWVETDVPCEVAVGSHVERTVTLLGHHYAFVTVDALQQGRPYTVALDGREVWPTDRRFKPSVTRSLPHDSLTVAFGSCRTILSGERGDPDRVDALREYAWRAATGRSDLPDALLLLGDQVYADLGAPATRRLIRQRRRIKDPVDAHTHEFAEFATLYREAWSEPAVRWLLSTVSTLMIFDDHEIIDNWNTSEQWLAEYQSKPWWRERVINGLAAYWVYQHLGNLSPDERESDPAFAALRGGDEGVAMEMFAKRAEQGAHGTQGVRWSYSRDLGPARLAMVDSRDGRVLADGQREMLDGDDWQWLQRQVREPAPYFLLGTSLPLLLPPGPHDLERITAVACAGRWGKAASRIGEELRQAAQLSHWASFPSSFAQAARLLRTATEQSRKGVIVLSGDVHFSYAARVVAWPDGTTPAVPVHQLVSSPLCHDLYGSVSTALGMGASRPGQAVGRLARRLAGAPPTALQWTLETKPWLHNVIGTLRLSSAGAAVRFESTRSHGALGTRLTPVVEYSLS